MASDSWLPVEELTCPVCRDIFKNPVLLQCSHSACKDCLREFWHHKGFQECPVCRKRSLSRPPPPVNRALKNLCEAYREKIREAPSVQDPEEERKAAIITLQGLLMDFERALPHLQKTAQHITAQAEKTEAEIREGLKKLHRFLKSEEEARIHALTMEKERKSRKMEEKVQQMEEETSAITDSIAALTDLDVESPSFSEDLQTIMRKAPCTLPDPAGPDTLIDVAKHLGNMQFKVWKRMKGIVSYSPVILEPNTASRSLILSECLTKVTDSLSILAPLPINTERFNNEWIRGSESFRSGTHSWEVAIDDSEDWCVGVVAASDVANADTMTDLTPKVWGVGYDEEFENMSALSPHGSLPLRDVSIPKKIGVTLDWEAGELSFSNPNDDTRLHTFSHRFTESVFPVFQIHSYMKILPVKTTVTKDVVI